MFKSQLQEYAQKAALPPPVYDFVKEGAPHQPRFKATVTVNGVSYESDPGFTNLKSAEHAAARVALHTLLKKSNGTGVAPAPVHESGLCKNLLQEYAQKSSLPLPVYRSTRCGEDHSPTFTSTVEIAGVKYSGGAAKSKKDAEIKAARTALLAIQTQAAAYARAEPDGQEQQRVMPLAYTGNTKKRTRQPSDTAEEVARGKKLPLLTGEPVSKANFMSSEGDVLLSLGTDTRTEEGPLSQDTSLSLEAPGSTQNYESGHEPSSQDSCLSHEVRLVNGSQQKTFNIPLYAGPAPLQAQVPIHVQPRQLLPFVQLEPGVSPVSYRIPVYLPPAQMQQFGLGIRYLNSQGFQGYLPQGVAYREVDQSVGQQVQSQVERYSTLSQEPSQPQLQSTCDNINAEASGHSIVPVSSV